ncbi:MAG: Gfo/Idh/MocA family oxidoreductase, partial [Actinobacteria bacterium]|nr:Gfo/Idh/MocA family oxidoreductase [Actinomycetota bacterium]
MRAVVLSFSHHGRGMATATRDLGHQIAGVMDPEEDPRTRLATEFNCPAFTDAGACLDAVKPDVALIAGKHIDAPAYVMACVDRRIPYVIDKPFTDCAARLRPAADATVKHGVISALTLPNRKTQFVAIVKRMQADGSLGELVLYNSRLNNGPPSRYDTTPSYWFNDPSISGGGCWATEASHGLDTFLQLSRATSPMVVAAVMSNALHRRAVEDSGLAIFRTADGVTGIIESGYSYPSGTYSGDHAFRVIGTKAVVLKRYDREHRAQVEVHTTSGVQFTPDRPGPQLWVEVVDEGLRAAAGGAAAETSIVDAVRIL